jgi:acetate kinase
VSQAIAVLNAGSSSLKFSLHEVVEGNLRVAVRGQIEGLGTTQHFKAKDAAGKTVVDADLPKRGSTVGHDESFEYLVEWLRGHFADRMQPVGVGHRVVHGGAEFIKPTLVDAQVLKKLEALIPLVPLHQPHNLAGIKAVTKIRPDLPQVACFDTAFHQGRASVTERFALPDELFQRGIRRWGFHGLSYEYVIGSFKKIAPDVAGGRVIAAHLGSGVSLCGMRNGKCVDTTMSFSVLDGLPMGTRCGSLDPGVILHLLKEMTAKEIESLLYKESGLRGISGVSNDVRELLASDKPRAAQAIDYFVYRAVREIGSLVAALGGLDALIFTAGVGENSPIIRERICAGLAFLGISLDDAANQAGKKHISRDVSRPSVWVIPTDEEAVIASHTLSVIQSMPSAPR